MLAGTRNSSWTKSSNYGSILYAYYENEVTRYRFPCFLLLTITQTHGNAILLALKISWIAIISYVALLPDSVGFRGWFKPCDHSLIHQVDETEAVSFSLESDPVTSSWIFGFKDIFVMLNLSWVPYN